MSRSLHQRTLLRRAWENKSKVNLTPRTEIPVLSGCTPNASKRLMKFLTCYRYLLLVQKESVATLAVLVTLISSDPLAALVETLLSPRFPDKIQLGGQTVISMTTKILTLKVTVKITLM